MKQSPVFKMEVEDEQIAQPNRVSDVVGEVECSP